MALRLTVAERFKGHKLIAVMSGKRLLAHRHSLKARLRITQATGTGAAVSVASQIVTFKAAKKGDPHRAR